MKGWYIASWLCAFLLVSDATGGRLEAFVPAILCFTVLYIVALRNRKKIAQWADDRGGEPYRQIGQRLRSSVRAWYFIMAAAIVLSVGERVDVSGEKSVPTALLLLTIALIVFEETAAERKVRKAAKRQRKECGQEPAISGDTQELKRSAQEKLARGDYKSITYKERMALVDDIRQEKLRIRSEEQRREKADKELYKKEQWVMMAPSVMILCTLLWVGVFVFLAESVKMETAKVLWITAAVFGGVKLGYSAYSACKTWRTQRNQILSNRHNRALAKAHAAGKIIDEAVLLNSTTELVKGGWLGALIGNMVADDIGALVGYTATVGTREMQRFAVHYTNGTSRIEEVEVGSRRYNELMTHVRWDDVF